MEFHYWSNIPSVLHEILPKFFQTTFFMAASFSNAYIAVIRTSSHIFTVCSYVMFTIGIFDTFVDTAQLK